MKYILLTQVKTDKNVADRKYDQRHIQKPGQTSKMELLAETVHEFHLLIIFA